MFQRMRRFFRRHEELQDDIGYAWRRIEEVRCELKEEIEVLHKIALLKNYINIEPEGSVFHGRVCDYRTKEEVEKDRVKARSEGYQFFFRYSWGKEIWVKDT